MNIVTSNLQSWKGTCSLSQGTVCSPRRPRPPPRSRPTRCWSPSRPSLAAPAVAPGRRPGTYLQLPPSRSAKRKVNFDKDFVFRPNFFYLPAGPSFLCSLHTGLVGLLRRLEAGRRLAVLGVGALGCRALPASPRHLLVELVVGLDLLPAPQLVLLLALHQPLVARLHLDSRQLQQFRLVTAGCR